MRKIIAGLDVGTHSVKITIAEKTPNGELHILANSQKPSGGLRRGCVIDPDTTTKSIKNAVKEVERVSGIPIKHAYLSIGGVKLETQRTRGNIMVSRADNEISLSDAQRAISQAENNLAKIANRTIIHKIPLAYKVDGEIIIGKPIGMKGEKLETDVLFVLCLNQHYGDLIKSVENAGIEIDDVVASPIAASFAALDKQQKEVGVILVELGAETTPIAIFEEGNLISLEIFPFGSSHITHDIAIGFQASLESAEELKFNYMADNQKRKLSDIVEARMDDIFELIRTHLKKIGRNELLPAGAVLTGGGANLSNVEILAKNFLKLPVKIGAPAIPIKTHDKYAHNQKWLTSLGLCILSNDKNLNPNGPLSPDDQSLKGSSINLKWLFPWFKSFLP